MEIFYLILAVINLISIIYCSITVYTTKFRKNATWCMFSHCLLDGKININHKVVQMLLYDASPKDKDVRYTYTEMQQWMFINGYFVDYYSLIEIISQMEKEELFPNNHPFMMPPYDPDNLPQTT